jgi:hypothetical protein
MQFVDKGNNWCYLVCDNSRRGRGCIKYYVPYKVFEELILKNTSQLDVRDLLPENDVQTERCQLQSKLKAITSELEETSDNINNLTDRITITPFKKVGKILDERMLHEIEKYENLKEKKSEIESLINGLSNAFHNTEEQIRSIKEFLNYIYSLRDEDELIQLRLKLRDNVRNLIYRIDIFPPGSKIKSSDCERLKKYFRSNSYYNLLELREKIATLFQLFYKIGNLNVVKGIHYDSKKREVLCKWAWIGDSTIPRLYRRLN